VAAGRRPRRHGEAELRTERLPLGDGTRIVGTGGNTPAMGTHYDPWRDVADNWPDLEITVKPLQGDLLGTVDWPVIALRAGTSAAQMRCTLAHELVHLERGIRECGPWADREELAVHSEVALRLIPIEALADAVAELGGTEPRGALASLLHVDSETIELRLSLLTRRERRIVRARAGLAWRAA
jgi:hypothetical protein